MYKTYEGKLVGKGFIFAIVISRFNEFISSKLLSGALDTLKRHDVREEDIEIFWVPGSFEIPVVAKKVATKKKHDAVICLGTVIKGATPHFDYVAAEVSKGIAKVGLDSEMPIMFGIITANNIEQAIERAGTKNGNKGFDVALSALEMVNLHREIDKS